MQINVARACTLIARTPATKEPGHDAQLGALGLPFISSASVCLAIIRSSSEGMTWTGMRLAGETAEWSATAACVRGNAASKQATCGIAGKFARMERIGAKLCGRSKSAD